MAKRDKIYKPVDQLEAVIVFEGSGGGDADGDDDSGVDGVVGDGGGCGDDSGPWFVGEAVVGSEDGLVVV